MKTLTCVLMKLLINRRTKERSQMINKCKCGGHVKTTTEYGSEPKAVRHYKCDKCGKEYSQRPRCSNKVTKTKELNFFRAHNAERYAKVIVQPSDSSKDYYLPWVKARAKYENGELDYDSTNKYFCEKKGVK